jgi:uncharacterized membrane protein
MKRAGNIIFNICFAINCLLVFLLLFESRMLLPSWLQVAGRMHPLILHFPITLLVLYIFWSLFVEKRAPHPESAKKFGGWLLLLSAFTASITALMGLFLSKETGYDAEALQWHKWTGLSVSVFTCFWYAFREKIKKINSLNISTAFVCLVLVVLAGHQGAGITHGQDFLLAPIMPEKQQPKILLEEAEVYAHMVMPILQSKCMNCHNSKKAKGELIMETEEVLLKGGKNGKLWDSTATDYGLLLQRIHLPLETKKHMPPQGKPQLTEQEKQILYAWIKSGANFKTKVLDLSPDDTLRLIATNLFNTIESDNYDFAAADEKKVQKLNTNYRVVYPFAIESPALAIEFFNAQFYKPEQLKELLAVKDQVVSLNLNKMPVKDEELKTISQFKNLRKLNLAFTNITGSTLNELSTLSELKQLSLSGTLVKASDILQLSSLQKLAHLYVWHTALEKPAVEKLKQSWKGLAIETGFTDDTTILKLTPPILQNEEQVISEPVALKLKHYINGVSIRYTLDGTEPDSINSPEYNSNIVLDKNVTVKAKAFKLGWISSDVMESYFFSAGHKADSVVNILPPDAQYKGDGAKTLADLDKGEAKNFRSGKWLGYRNNKMESLFMFNSPVTVSSVTISSLIDIGGYIMPPAFIEIWGGDNSNKLQLLNRMIPHQPSKVEPAYLKAFDCSFKPVSVKYIKLISTPVAKLPAWHPGKGDKGWLFVDEVFIN